MYICKDCGDVFEHPEVTREKDYVGEGGHYGAIYSCDESCPCCGSENFVEACECANCGEWFPGKYEDFCCEACADEYFAREEQKKRVAV
jgi:hypothetical protein